MTRFPDDPEVIADLRFRDASEHDEERSSLVGCDDCKHHVRDHDAGTGPCRKCGCTEFVRPGGAQWKPDAIVERWPCTGCTALVDMPAYAIELHAMFNRQLERRRERPLPKRIPCADCKRRDEELIKAQGTRQDNERPTTAEKGRP